MTKLLDTAAIGIRTGQDAAEILQAYIGTEPVMVFSHTPPATPQPQRQRSGPSGGQQR